MEAIADFHLSASTNTEIQVFINSDLFLNPSSFHFSTFGAFSSDKENRMEVELVVTLRPAPLRAPPRPMLRDLVIFHSSTSWG